MARVEEMAEGMDGAERVAGTAEAVQTEAPRILSTNADACQCTWGR